MQLHRDFNSIKQYFKLYQNCQKIHICSIISKNLCTTYSRASCDEDEPTEKSLLNIRNLVFSLGLQQFVDFIDYENTLISMECVDASHL